MSGRLLSRQDLEDILLGATILGTGGGGEPAEGRQLIDEALSLGKEFKLVSVADVPDDALICTPYMLGALSDVSPDQDPSYARLPRGNKHSLLLAYDRFQKHLGQPFHGVVACELGGANTAAAFYCAAMNGHVIVDADPSGRAVPEIQHTTYYLAGLDPGDLVFANAFGETFIYENVYDDVRAERIARALAMASCNDIAAIDHAFQMSTLRSALIDGTISFSLRLGQAVFAAKSKSADIAEVVAGEGAGAEIFRGEISSCDWRTEDGFTLGKIGLSDGRGQRCEIDFKNENMSVRIDGEVVATIPDLICLLDLETGAAVTNPMARIGTLTAVVILPAPEPFNTPAGRALFGPSYIGL